MNESEDGQLDSIIASVEDHEPFALGVPRKPAVIHVDDVPAGVHVDDVPAGAPPGGGTSPADEEGLQEKLRLQFRAAKESLGTHLNLALEMVDEQLQSTRCLEEQLAQLRHEKSSLSAELAALRDETLGCASDKCDASGDDRGGKCGAISVNFISAAESDTSAYQSDGDGFGLEMNSGSFILGAGVPDPYVDYTAGAGSAGQGGRYAGADPLGPGEPHVGFSSESMTLIIPCGTEPPPLPNTIGDSPMTMGLESIEKKPAAAKSAMKSAMKGKDATAATGAELGRPASADGAPQKSADAGRGRSLSPLPPAKSPSTLEPGFVAKGGMSRIPKKKTMSRSRTVEVLSKSEEDGKEATTGSISSFASANPEDYALMSCWKADKRNTTEGDQTVRIQRRLSQMMFDLSTLDKGVMTMRGEEDDENLFLKCFNRVNMHPSSRYRITWDVSGVFVVAYDMITLPLLSAFQPTPNAFIKFMVWVTRLFWTFDIFQSCITGFMRTDGVVEMRPFQIWKRYARTWMTLDMALVGIDWVEVCVSLNRSIDLARFGKASRLFRILRLLRLLRLFRFRQLMQYFEERIRSERLIVLADIAKFVMMILLSAHFAACMWYGIGVSSGEKNWVKEHIDKYDDSASVALRYAISLHWSLSQFAGGMSEFVPQNFAERMYAVILFIIAFMMAAVLVSVLTSEITRLKIISNTHAQQMSILRRFLSDNSVSTKLGVRVQRNARHALAEQQRHIPETSVELLQLVSEPLRVELHFEIQSPLLSKHPFFGEYIEACPHIMRKVCHKCTEMAPYFSGDAIFTPGEVPRPPKMFFVANGSFEYFLMSGRRVAVRVGTWLSEPVMWTEWSHKGGLRAKGDSHLYQLKAETFQQVCSEFDYLSFDPRIYGARFVQMMNACEGTVTDLPMIKDQLEEASASCRPAKQRQGSNRGSRLLALGARGSRMLGRHSTAADNKD